ncbi:MAG: hypothetical protein HY921_05095 [Elusimicrobia bacterium]|nr:hypothetical protein [Elusimicrobiota bacterium]
MKTMKMPVLAAFAAFLALPSFGQAIPAVSKKLVAASQKEDELPERYEQIVKNFDALGRKPELAKVVGTWKWVDDGFNYVPKGYTMNGKPCQIVISQDGTALVQYVAYQGEAGPLPILESARSLVLDFTMGDVFFGHYILECRTVVQNLVCKASIKGDPQSRHFVLERAYWPK